MATELTIESGPLVRAWVNRGGVERAQVISAPAWDRDDLWHIGINVPPSMVCECWRRYAFQSSDPLRALSAALAECEHFRLAAWTFGNQERERLWDAVILELRTALERWRDRTETP